MCRKFPAWPATQAHRNLRVNENCRCKGWSDKEWAKFCTLRRKLQTVNFYIPKRRFKRSILTVLGFSRFGNEITKQDPKLNRHEKFLFRPIMITVSVRIPKCHRTQVSQSFGELQVSQCGTPSQRTSSQTRSQAERRRQQTHQPHARGWRSATESPCALWHTDGSQEGHPRYTSVSTERGRFWPETVHATPPQRQDQGYHLTPWLPTW